MAHAGGDTGQGVLMNAAIGCFAFHSYPQKPSTSQRRAWAGGVPSLSPAQKGMPLIWIRRRQVFPPQTGSSSKVQ